MKNTLELDTSKAGMQGVDKARVEQIVNQLSKNSPFYQNELRKQAAREKRIAKLLRLSGEFDALPRHSKAQIEKSVEQELQEIYQCTRIARYCALDMDSYHASVEELDRPELKNVPMAVGGMSMLGTSNYAARQYGVRAAMPGHIAKVLCPQLVIVPPHFEKYERMTQKVRAVAAKFDPDFVSHGGDELCIRLNRRTFENARAMIEEYRKQQQEQQQNDNEAEFLPLTSITEDDIAAELRRRVFEATGGLTASCGIGPTRMLAKIVSNFSKPNGQFVLSEVKTLEQVREYAWQHLNVRQIPGIGKVTELMLSSLGIKTCKELYDNRVRLKHTLLPKSFSFLLQASVGLVGAVRSTPQRHHGFTSHREQNKQLDVKQGERQNETGGGGHYDPLQDNGSEATSDDDDANNEDDDDGDRHGASTFGGNSASTHSRKHSVGCERTFYVKKALLNNNAAGQNPEQAEATRIFNKVFNSAIGRLLDVARHSDGCRVYQIVVKAKKTSYEVKNASVNVAVVVKAAPPRVKEEKQEHEDQKNDGDDEDAAADDPFQVKPEQEEEQHQNQQHQEVASSDDDDDNDANKDAAIAAEELAMLSADGKQTLRDKFWSLCESTGFISTASNFRLLGCRFAYHPGAAATAKVAAVAVASKKRSSNKNTNKFSAAAAAATSSSRIRQRTIDEFFGKAAAAATAKSSSSAAATETIDLVDSSDEDDDEATSKRNVVDDKVDCFSISSEDEDDDDDCLCFDPADDLFTVVPEAKPARPPNSADARQKQQQHHVAPPTVITLSSESESSRQKTKPAAKNNNKPEVIEL